MAYTIEDADLCSNNARKTNSKAKPDGYIYILKLKGYSIYKIGVSANPKRRIRDIDSHNPFGVDKLLIKYFKNVYNMEECIHDSFKDNLMRKEWFKLHKEDVEILKKQLINMSDKGIYLTRK